ncbi:MAG: hypothetical protein GY945_14925, partial [Rhodobacteraceae bacterium]|nr:hypothetical protein [Paracoccaceae bacterium]
SSLDWDAIRLGSVRDALRTHLKTQLADPLKSAGLTGDAIAIVEVAQVRYRGQSYAIEITDPKVEDPAALGETFQRLHDKLYGFATDEPWELVSIRMTASVPQGENRARTTLSTGTKAEPIKSPLCVFEQSGEIQTPRYERNSLPINHPICGPLVVEDAFSTVIVPPGATLTADDAGNLLIDIGEGQ